MTENHDGPSPRVRFGPFVADLETHELRKHGVRLRLPGQSFQVLKMLLERPGKLVMREEFRLSLWPADTFVDFDHGLSAAVNRLREALGDSAENPVFIETLTRRGYRWIAGAEWLAESVTGSPLGPDGSAQLMAGELLKTQVSFGTQVWQIGDDPASADRIAAVDSGASQKQATIAPAQTAKTPRLVYVVAGAISILVGAFALWRWHHPMSPTFVRGQFTALPGWVEHPALAPDGSRIAFAWTGDPDIANNTGVDLYVKTVGSENLLRLTNHPSDLISAAWSPDGKQIAFHRLSKDESGIYVVPSLGGPERKLRATHGSFGSRRLGISWSPDGKSIAFSDSPVRGGHQRIQFLSLETLEVSQIEHDERCQEEVLPAFSHDGIQVAYGCFPSTGDFALSVATSTGVAPRMMKEFSGWLNGFAWTGDNKRLIFSQFKQGGPDDVLRELTLADNTVRDLPFGTVGSWPSIAMKGDRIAYIVGTLGKNDIWRQDLLHPNEPPVKLISSTRDQFCPQYSPDGKHIAFGSSRGGTAEIWMSDADGKDLMQLSNLKNSQTGTPSWSPDSTKIVFDSRTAGHADLYIVDIAERAPRKLATSTGEASVPSWSRDGKWIYFIGGGRAEGERIYRVRPDGGRATVLSSARGYGPLGSFDSQMVYFAAVSGPNTTLEVASLNPTGTESPVEGMPPLSFAANWTIVRDGVYFYPAEDFKTLSYFDFSTKQVHPVVNVKGGSFFGLSVSPDGRYILYTLHQERSDIMLVSNSQ